MGKPILKFEIWSSRAKMAPNDYFLFFHKHCLGHPRNMFFVDSRALGLNVYNNRCPLFDFHRCLIRFIRILKVFCGFKLFYCFYSVLIGFTSWIRAGPGGQTHLCEPPLPAQNDTFCLILRDFSSLYQNLRCFLLFYVVLLTLLGFNWFYKLDPGWARWANPS